MSQPIILLSSGGKDSLATLEALRADEAWTVIAMLTTFNEKHDRVAMHGTRRELMRAQADALELPLIEVDLPDGCSNEVYEARMAGALKPLKARGNDHVACGDLFLEDIRDYRVAQYRKLGLKAVFPIWHTDTSDMAHRLMKTGWRAILTCVDGEQIDPAFCGREWTPALVSGLPESADPCGENGEFHTFVFDCPLFSAPIPVSTGSRHVSQNRFHFADLMI